MFWTKNTLKITIINCTSQIEYQIKSFPIKGPKGTYVDDMSILTFHVRKKAMCQVLTMCENTQMQRFLHILWNSKGKQGNQLNVRTRMRESECICLYVVCL